MRKALIGGLRIVVPLALGVWLVVFFYRQLDEHQRKELFDAFGMANWWWLGLSILLGVGSHLSRAWRWRYLLRPMGHETSFFNAYNATMAGYFINLLLPRAGEASRAVLIGRAEGVPFEKGFGTIMAERAVDMIMLLGIAALTLALQLDKMDLFEAQVSAFRAARPGASPSTGHMQFWPWALFGLVLLGVLAVVVLLRTRPALRARLRMAATGFLEGLGSVLSTPNKVAFIGHTMLIWSLYVAMFKVGFHALEATSNVPFAGVMAGFIAGSIGIILVQGGIGAYPAFVALIVGLYMGPAEGGGLIRPDALAMGWLLWAAQTVMIIALGGLSLLLMPRSGRTPAPPPSRPA